MRKKNPNSLKRRAVAKDIVFLFCLSEKIDSRIKGGLILTNQARFFVTTMDDSPQLASFGQRYLALQ